MVRVPTPTTHRSVALSSVLRRKLSRAHLLRVVTPHLHPPAVLVVAVDSVMAEAAVHHLLIAAAVDFPAAVHPVVVAAMEVAAA